MGQRVVGWAVQYPFAAKNRISARPGVAGKIGLRPRPASDHGRRFDRPDCAVEKPAFDGAGRRLINILKPEEQLSPGPVAGGDHRIQVIDTSGGRLFAHDMLACGQGHFGKAAMQMDRQRQPDDVEIASNERVEFNIGGDTGRRQPVDAGRVGGLVRFANSGQPQAQIRLQRSGFEQVADDGRISAEPDRGDFDDAITHDR